MPVTLQSAPPPPRPAEHASPLRTRDATLRLNDLYEVYERPDPGAAQREATRCMSCGAAFCMPQGGYRDNTGSPAGCPISNRIPEWNELVERGRWREAYDRLALTNNFPEFTARVCPAPCQDACIVGIHDRPVAIKSIERAIIDAAFDHGWVTPRVPATRTGRHVAIVGSGPAGLAAADDLNAAGHWVSVYERADTPGGLLYDGIPSMKLDKAVVARRIALLEQTGIRFLVNEHVGQSRDARQVLADHDALVLATGSLGPRDLRIPGRSLAGITQAMPYLTAANRHWQRGAALPSEMDARHRRVVIIGGGDTGADCIATALRQGVASVINLTRRDQPPAGRDHRHPWPGPTGGYTLDYAHAEGLARDGRDPRAFSIQPLAFEAAPKRFSDEPSRVGAVRIRQLDLPTDHPEHETSIVADMVILAIGFTSHDSPGLFEQLSLSDAQATLENPSPKLYISGDLRMGSSLVVHAIAEGQRIAKRIHASLGVA